MKGKIYQQMAIPDSLKAITNLLYLNNQFYCTLEVRNDNIIDIIIIRELYLLLWHTSTNHNIG